MSRKTGDYAFPSNFECSRDGPIDARMATPLFSHLTDGSSIPFKYLGMLVAITENSSDTSKNGLYILSSNDGTNASDWTKVGADVSVMGADDVYDAGLVPAGASDGTGFLRQDGSWTSLPDNVPPFFTAISTASEGMLAGVYDDNGTKKIAYASPPPNLPPFQVYISSATDGQFLRVNEDANGNLQVNYESLSVATTEALGGVQLGYTDATGGKNYPVQLSSNKAYVNVPWENTEYDVMGESDYNAGLVPAGGSSHGNTYLRKDGMWGTPTNTQYDVMGDLVDGARDYSAGLVPAGNSSHGNTYLRKDGTWSIPLDTDTEYTAGTNITINGSNQISASGIQDLDDYDQDNSVNITSNNGNINLDVNSNKEIQLSATDGSNITKLEFKANGQVKINTKNETRFVADDTATKIQNNEAPVWINAMSTNDTSGSINLGRTDGENRFHSLHVTNDTTTASNNNITIKVHDASSSDSQSTVATFKGDQSTLLSGNLQTEGETLLKSHTKIECDMDNGGNDLLGVSPQLLVKCANNSGRNCAVQIRGARDGSTGSENAILMFTNYDEDGTSGQTTYGTGVGVLGKIVGYVTHSSPGSSSRNENTGDLRFYTSSDGQTTTECFKLKHDNTMDVSGNITCNNISVSGTLTLSGTLSGVAIPSTITPSSDALPREFVLNSAQNFNVSSVTFLWKDPNTSGTTTYSQGITHTFNTGQFTVNNAGTYLINFFIKSYGGISNNRMAGYATIRRYKMNTVTYNYDVVHDYTVGGYSYYRDNNDTIDDYVISATTNLTFEANDRFEVRAVRVYNEGSGNILADTSVSFLRIEKINYTLT